MRPAMLALGTLSILLTGVIAMELRPGAPAEDPAQALLPGSPAASPRALSGPEQSGEWIATALARPIFSQMRRPPSPARAAQAAAGGLPRLAGIIIGPFGRRAIFAGPEGGKPLVLEEGDTVGGFGVRTIENGQVTLNGPEGERILRPAFADAGNASAATVPPPSIGDMPPGFPPPGFLSPGFAPSANPPGNAMPAPPVRHRP